RSATRFFSVLRAEEANGLRRRALLHGKEAALGSSPREGFAEGAANRRLRCQTDNSEVRRSVALLVQGTAWLDPLSERRGSTVRVRQRASPYFLVSAFSVVCFGVSAWLRCPPGVHQRPLRRHGACPAAGPRARGRLGRGGLGGRSWSGWRPGSGRGRRWRCR